VQLPLYRADSQGVTLLTTDYVGDTKSAPAAANGTTSLQWDAVPVGYLWRVEIISVRATSSTAPQVVVTAGARVMANTYAGNYDIADQCSPILVQGGEQLGFSWYGIDAGQTPTVDIQYAVLKRTGFNGGT
jgi:hypothetical protein